MLNTLKRWMMISSPVSKEPILKHEIPFDMTSEDENKIVVCMTEIQSFGVFA
jgi:hypothetical protein